MIYFVQPIDGGPVKIGTTDNLSARLAQLESHYGRPLALLGTAEGGPDEERAWHRRFDHLRFGRTEQFRPAPELMEAIGRPLLVGANPEAVEPLGVAIRRQVLTVKGTDEWAEWLTGLSEFLRTPTSSVVDHALVRYAKEVGYEVPVPKR